MNNTKIINENNVPPKDIYRIWIQTLGDQWTISKSQFEKIVGDSQIYTARDSENNIIAFLSFRSNKTRKLAQLITIVVLPEHQNKGTGTELLNILTNKIKGDGINEIKLGTGIGSYFWPGTPDNLVHAKSFFEKHKFIIDEEAVDMVQEISEFPDYQEILDRPSKDEIKISYLPEKLVDKLLSFEKDNFAEWYSYFTNKIEKEEFDDILIALDSHEKILGSMVLLGTEEMKWNLCFDGQVGGFGALGVSKEARGQGIGLAMSVKATSILKDRGFTHSFLGWTYLIDWYGKIGYKVWRTYSVGQKKL